jgi:hypothetical protein
VGEVRATDDKHSSNSGLDTRSYYALLGTDVRLSRRFNATVRGGEVLQTFTEGGGSASSPYGELSLSYRFSPATSFGWNARYGYEEADTAGSRNIVARTGLQLSQIFTPRFQAVLGVNLLRSKITNSATSTSSGASTTTSTNGTTTSNVSLTSVTDTVDASLAFYYTLNRHWSVNLTYSYTTGLGPITADDYYRQRVFLGASYQF